MKLCYKVCTSKCVDIEFQHIYDYIKSENPDASLDDIYWMFCDDIDYYIKTLYDAPDFWQRCDLVKMALESMSNCSISTIESRISAPFYSYKTLEKLRDVYPAARLYIIVGADVASEIKRWEHGDWILNNFELIIVNRNGIIYDGRVDITDTIDVSSTAVREMYKQGKQVCPLVPAKVDNFIKKYKIYE